MSYVKLNNAALRAKREIVKGQMIKLVNYVNELDDNFIVEQLTTRLTRANELLKTFTEIEDHLLNFSDRECSEIDEFEDQYYHVVSELNANINRVNLANKGFTNDESLSTGSKLSESNVRLPRINIPTFNGDFKDWYSFHDLFIRLVHENKTLSAAEKFQYLKGALTGEAKNSIRHMAASEANYLSAFKTLVNRYDKKKYIMNSFVDSFLKVKPIKTPDAKSLRTLTDEYDEVFRGLKALGPEFETRDPIMVYLMLNNLDKDNQERWADKIAKIDCPTVAHMLQFLNDRTDAAHGYRPQPEIRSKTPSHSTPQSSKFAHVASNDTCECCKNSVHNLYECTKFKELNITDRRKFTKDNSRCYNCLSSKHGVYRCRSKGKCDKCKRRHHTLLHLDEVNSPTEPTVSSLHANSPNFIKSNEIKEDITINTNNELSTVLLPTALVVVKSSTGIYRQCRALLDSGSQMSFITEACAQKLQLHRSNARVSVTGLGNSSAAISRGMTELIVASRHNNALQIQFNALILPRITSQLPSMKFIASRWDHLAGIELADPEYNKPSNIDILIGADQFFKILNPEKIMKEPHQPIAQSTLFGWVIAGEINSGNIISTVNLYAEIDIDRSLRQFWELEEIPVNHPTSEEEQACEDHFKNNLTRSLDGKFVVRLPFKTTDAKLGESRSMAVARLKSMERKFQKDLIMKNLYIEFMREYETLNHMERIPDSEIQVDDSETFYLPHHGVMKESSSTTKLRVVFDGSASSKSGQSLNNLLMVGPTIQPSLISILQRFRIHRIVFSADVEKMYRQVLIDRKDVDYQRIVWREDPSTDIKFYRLLTVTYGTASASFLATRVLQEISEGASEKYTDAANIIKDDFYVDDLMSGAETEERAVLIQHQIKTILDKAGFHLRKWSSNSKILLKNIPDEDKEMENVVLSEDSTVKVLGLEWHPSSDTFSFRINVNSTPSTTKRQILSEAAKIFDPLGWLSPTVVLIKIFFQQLWLLKLDWDENLPKDVEERWLTLRSELPLLQQISIPRWLEVEGTMEIHGFSDASELAYAAAVYCRIIKPDGKVKVNLITSKTKVAPIRQISIPRLELCAAVLLSRLLTSTLDSMKIKDSQVFAWTDSTIVLQWLSQPSRQWKTFVANRVSEIQNLPSYIKWSHVRSTDNPADCASRGINPSQLIQNSLWWHGPDWLLNEKLTWPSYKTKCSNHIEDVNAEKRSEVRVFAIEKPPAIVEELTNRISSFAKLVNVLAWVTRFCKNYPLRPDARIIGNLMAEETKYATVKIFHWVQGMEFADERSALRKKKPISSSSKIASLNPFLDENEILRVGGRIQNSMASFETKHPIILPAAHPITIKIVTEQHLKNCHAGASLLAGILRQTYWIIRSRNIVRTVIHDCIICVRHQHTVAEQQMGNLPEPRVTYTRPFLNTGVDYAGPLVIRLEKGRGHKTHHAYIALFVCLSTKAVHIELVNDLTSESFLAALQRFVARRGLCRDIYSDNGTNFVGAKGLLTDLFNFFNKNSNVISEFLLRDKISWHFIPPAAPHFGGLWEAAVKSTKYHLRRVIGNSILTYEEMSTLLAKIESILNSRPICPMPSDELDALTPAHFLIGHPYTYLPEPDVQQIKLAKLSRWQMVLQMSQHFWKRWHQEYLTALQRRHKWRLEKRNIKVDDIVVIKDENLPPARWLLGKVVEVYPGKDDLVRVVTLKTKTGILKRPINKVCILPVIEDDASRPPGCSIET